MQTISDELLLSKLKTEENQGFELLYKFYFPSLAFFIKQNRGTHEDAEDIFQEAVVVLYQKINKPAFTLTSSLKTYLFAIAKNLWLKRLRQNKIILTDDNSQLNQFSEESDTHLFEIQPEKSSELVINFCLKKITEHCRQILTSLFLLQEPIENLMVKMKWKNKHTASNQKYKCMQQAKKQIEFVSGT
jgi:RNA polymerase sigma factor (sigma-70 family)